MFNFFFIQERNRIYEEYKNILLGRDEQDDQQRNKTSDFIAETYQNFGWSLLLKSLANDNILNIKDVENLPLFKILEYLLILDREHQLDKAKNKLNNPNTL